MSRNRPDASYHRPLASLMERRRREESGADYEEIRRNWVLGSDPFRQELLAAVSNSHYGQKSGETVETVGPQRGRGSPN